MTSEPGHTFSPGAGSAACEEEPVDDAADPASPTSSSW